MRIYESRKKFSYFVHETTEKKMINQKVSSCLTEKCNGFYIIQIEYDQKERMKFVSINLIYKPVKDQKIKINLFCSNLKHLAYRSTYNDVNKISIVQLGSVVVVQTIMVVKMNMKDI